MSGWHRSECIQIQMTPFFGSHDMMTCALTHDSSCGVTVSRLNSWDLCASLLCGESSPYGSGNFNHANTFSWFALKSLNSWEVRPPFIWMKLFSANLCLGLCNRYLNYFVFSKLLKGKEHFCSNDGKIIALCYFKKEIKTFSSYDSSDQKRKK